MATLKHCVLAVLLSVSAFGARDAAALSYLMMQDETLFEQAEGVALFEVTSVAASPEHGETRYGLRPLDRLSGKALARSETLVLPGYVAKDEQLVFDGVPFLGEGQRVLLFHSRRADGDLQAMQLTLGMFFPVDTKRGTVYLRQLDGSNDLSAGKNARYAQPRDARGFERWIRRRGRGIDATPDYLIDAASSQEKYNITQITISGIPRPARWFQFEEGTTIPWFAVAGGQQGTDEDEFSLLQQGIAAWVSDPGSLILMNYASTGSSSANNAANVTWNDPANQIPGDFTCPGGGILGAGGSSANSLTRQFDGTTWYPRLRGTLITQPGFGCFVETYGTDGGIEFFVHEIGHVLGFAHSCEQGQCVSGSLADQATMRYQLHVDGRGGTLQTDDIAAARFVYPDATPAPTANLSLTLDASPAVVPIGQTITYDITVTNAGPDAAASLVVTHAVPAGTQIEGASGAGWSCGSTGTTVTCTRPSLGNGASAAIEVQVDVPLDYTGPDGLNSQASVDSATDDPNDGNNDDSVTTILDRILDRIFGNSFE